MRMYGFYGMAGAICLVFLGTASAQVTVNGGRVSVSTEGTAVNVDTGRVFVKTAPGGQTAVASENDSTKVNVTGGRTTVKSDGQTAVAVGSGRKAINIGSGNEVRNERGTINGQRAQALSPAPTERSENSNPGQRRKTRKEEDPFWGDEDFWGDEGEPGRRKAEKAGKR